jgi:midasin (ATPase involved in ribosome maturation)
MMISSLRRLKKNTGLSEAKKCYNDVFETIGEKELNIIMGSRSSLEPEPDSKLVEVMFRPLRIRLIASR